jgi:hypothetical protein
MCEISFRKEIKAKENMFSLELSWAIFDPICFIFTIGRKKKDVHGALAMAAGPEAGALRTPLPQIAQFQLLPCQ